MFSRLCSRLCSRLYSSQPPRARVKYIFEKKPLDQTLQVNGWVKAIRRMKQATFIDLDDGSTTQKLQVVLGKDADLSSLSYHCGVTVAGTLRASSHPKQEVELHATQLQVVGGISDATAAYPFAARRQHPPDYVRQFQHVRARTNTFASTLRTRAQARQSISEHMDRAGFVHVDAPLTSSNECEGGSNVFTLQATQANTDKNTLFFGQPVFLSVSGQMHLEALANGLSSVYTFNPAFRAEPSLGRRHLAEFWMVEAEEAFMAGEEGLQGLLARMEGLVQDTLAGLLQHSERDLALHWLQQPDTEASVRQAATAPFTRLRYSDALDRLSAVRPVKHGMDLTREDELQLTELCGGPVFVTHWPVQSKPFYMAHSTEQPDTVLCVDLLLPGVGEVAGGSVREHDPRLLQARLPPAQNLDWYVQLREWGGVPTAGYGLGFERLLLFALGVRNIRDVVPFPRWPGHCLH